MDRAELPLFPLPPSQCQSPRSNHSCPRGNLCGTESPSSPHSQTLFWLQGISSHPPSSGEKRTEIQEQQSFRQQSRTILEIKGKQEDEETEGT